MESRARIVKQNKSKEGIAYTLLKNAMVKKFKAIREEIISSLGGCGLEVEEMMSFSAAMMEEALKECIGEV